MLCLKMPVFCSKTATYRAEKSKIKEGNDTTLEKNTDICKCKKDTK